ncbi:MAG: FliM/FliN family flagellar motor switch protein [Proteobacteria bacterium]|nr:FliM/FliN family flagellar motor switch protein [Pseudomonadota bacterium]
MTETVLDWIPDRALTDDKVAAALDQAIEGWAERWFGAHRCVHRTPWIVAPKPATAGSVVSVAAEPARQSLLGQALGLSGALPPGHDGDDQLLDRFFAHLIGDLREGVMQCLPVAAADRDASGIGCALQVRAAQSGTPRVVADLPLAQAGAARGANLTLWIGRAAATALRKQLCPVQKLRAPQAVSLACLAGGSQADFAAKLGMVRLSAAELADLAVGDVLVLDHDAPDSVELITVPGGAMLGRARLALGGDQLALQFQRGKA